MPIKFREHRGTLIDSMETVVEVGSKQELVKVISERLGIYSHGINISMDTIQINPYGFDTRIGWDTYIVTLANYGVVGFTNGKL
jgi:hypothetical protein